MMLSCSSVFVNRLPQPRSLMPEGREKLRFRVFCFGVEKPASYKAPEAMISRGGATSVSPKSRALSVLAFMLDLQAADDTVPARAPKYTSSGVA